MRVVVVRLMEPGARADQYRASLENLPDIFSVGKSESEAIGELIKSNSHRFGIKIQYASSGGHPIL